MYKFLKIFFAVILVLYALFVALVGWLSFGEPGPAEDITWGVTYGHSQAESLGMDGRETYTALLDDLGVRRFRLPVYWDELEPEDDNFNFEEWDWQLEQLEKRGGKAILVVGFKLPRWPECRTPDWLEANPRGEQFQQELLEMLTTVVNRYKDNDTVIAWQVENEPLLVFGECPDASPDLLDKEIDLVKKLDPSRPIIITDTGEFSFWYEAGKRADIVGSTLYRIIHDPKAGFIKYWFFDPSFYARKVDILHLWKPDTKVIVTELQAEPWVTSLPISKHSFEEQFRTMSPEQFRRNINFAKQTGIDTFYLWGSEWWYWAKQQGHPEFWNMAKEIFNDQ